MRVECCTICGSDLHTVTGAREEVAPSILGHEILGTVVRVGDTPPSCLDGRPLQPGDRVTWSTVVSCGDCERCRRGLPQKCRSLSKYGHALAEGRTALSGGFAEFLLLQRGSSVARIGTEIPAEVLCPVNCATATVAAAFRAARDVAERRVLIIGAGLLGLTAAAFARSRNAAKVAVCDIDPERLSRASHFGADTAIEWPPHTGRESDRFDVVFEMSGSADAVELTCEVADVGATVVLVGSVKPSRPVPIDPERIVRQWLTIRGVHNYGPQDLQTAVVFLQQHQTRFPFADLVESSYSLSDINEALEFAVRERPVRVAIRP